MQLHHVQVSMPRDQEESARAFYGAALGLTEVLKPAALAGRGGAWFRAVSGGTALAEIHLGVEEPFVPASKAHPALLLEDVDALETLAERIEGAGFEVSWAERDTFSGFVRFHSRDGFGNRVELLAPVPTQSATEQSGEE
ncbi:VOC family protein [Ornithinimicrobium cryptoxanthini]|uniref:VOC family protein n=1 Tax=Ornithinimicrobium cryptoxanthini TaxID=2934161 RepID=A0ABY4YF44_9MICO|nr:VOC family protein [Ornithinimicrobium cryptoxanthini]USQ75384.1 VOC family protein [Ornithinimicrobium cryptoxanthini]